MPRHFVLLCACLLAWLGDAALAAADVPGQWPEWIGSFEPQSFPRGAGYYFSLPKILLSLIVIWCWTASTDWVNRDAQYLKLDYLFYNLVIVGSFFAGFLLLFILPWFALSFLVLLGAYVGPLAYYVSKRNKPLADADKVFTSEHIKFVLASKLKRFGIKDPAKARAKPTSAMPLSLLPRNTATPAEEQMRLIAVRQSAGHTAARNLIYRALENRASAAMLDFTAEAAALRFMVDGVWLDVEAQSRQTADPALATLKTLCGLKPDDRRTRQQGAFIALNDVTKARVPSKFTSQGTKTGERAIVQFEDPGVRKRRLPDLGLRQKVNDDLQVLLKEKTGMIIVAAMPGGGLTSLLTACLAGIDRFTCSVMAVEEKSAKDIEVENVHITTYDSLEQETAKEKVIQIVRQFPEVMVVPDYVDGELLGLLCDEALERLIVTTVRAKDASEALVRPLTTKVPPKKYAKAVKGVIAQRLIRKLCDKCKEAYAPPPQILQRMGLTPDKVPAFYRPPTKPREEPCFDCKGLGYFGQTALYELIVVSDPVRQQLLKEPTVEAVRLAARKAGMKTMEDEGLLLVAKGVTSVQELSRVLKEAST